MLALRAAGSGNTAVTGVDIHLDTIRRFVHKVEYDSMRELVPRSCGLLRAKEVEMLEAQLKAAAAGKNASDARVLRRPIFFPALCFHPEKQD